MSESDNSINPGNPGNPGKEDVKEQKEKKEEAQETDHSKGLVIPTNRARLILCVGKPAQGKSHLVRYLLQEGFRSGWWKYGLIFSGTADVNEDYGFFPQKWVRPYSNDAFLNYINHIKGLYKKAKEEKREMPGSVLVLDDSMGAVNWYTDDWINLFGNRRHYGLSIIVVSQCLFSAGKGTSTAMRGTLDYGFFWQAPDKPTIEGLFKSFGSLAFEKMADFTNAFRDATSVEHRCMFFDSYAPVEKQFGSYLAPAEYQIDKIEGF